MNKIHSVKYNLAMNAILKVANIIYPIITFPYVSRILLPAGTGKASFGASVVTYFLLAAQLGIPVYGIRECGRVRDDKEKLTRLVHELLIINTATMTLAYAAFIICIFAIPRLSADKPLFLTCGLAIFLNVLGVEWLYQGLEQYQYITIRSVVFKAIALAATFLLIHTQKDYVIYAGITVFASSGSYVLNFINLRKIVPMRWLGGYHVRRHLRPVLIFLGLAASIEIYNSVDKVMLGFMKTDAEVGYYNAAVKVKNVLVAFLGSVGSVTLPRASNYMKKGRMDDFRKMSAKALNGMLVLAVPIMVYFIFFAKECILFLSGNDYLPSIAPMQFLMPTVLLIGITSITGTQMLVPMDKQKYVFYSTLGGAVIDVIVNALLIPGMNSTGAAIGTLVAEIVVLIIQVKALGPVLPPLLANISYGKIILGTFAATIASIWLKMTGLRNFIILIAGAAVFFAVYFGLLCLMKEKMTVSIVQGVAGRLKHRSRPKE